MSKKYIGLRALGNMQPEMRSAFLNISRAVRSMSQVHRFIPLAAEQGITRGAGIQAIRNNSTGSRAITSSAGRDADKPNPTLMQQRGIRSLIYIALDTNKVYIWNGVAYKSSTFT